MPGKGTEASAARHHALLWWWANDAQLSEAAPAAHGWRAGSLDWARRDPFDRMLAAQAMLDRLTLVTRDPAFVDLAVPTLW